MRFALAGVVSLVGYLSVCQSLAVALPDRQVEQAYALAPNNGRIGARLSMLLSSSEAAADNRDRAVQVASASLERDPTAVEALATLGIDALAQGDEARAKGYFMQSQRLSRRDLRTQLWAIEDAIAQDDVVGALRHYDIALRTKERAPNLLYPILSDAINDTNVRSALVGVLRKRPVWAQSFVRYAAANTTTPASTAELLKELRRVNLPIPNGADSDITKVLFAYGQFDQAWSYYAFLNKGATRSQSRDPDFKSGTDAPLVFDWIAENPSGISTLIQPGENGGVFDFVVAPSVSGRMLQQMQMLPAGEYVLEGTSIGIEEPAGARPYWALGCIDGREIGRLNMPNSSEQGGSFRGTFQIPANCPVQVLGFFARSSTKIGGITGQIDRALLHPSI